jgi:hypothetical protein
MPALSIALLMTGKRNCGSVRSACRHDGDCA